MYRISRADVICKISFRMEEQKPIMLGGLFKACFQKSLLALFGGPYTEPGKKIAVGHMQGKKL